LNQVFVTQKSFKCSYSWPMTNIWFK